MGAPSTPALGNTAASFDADMVKHLRGAINWAAGQSDPVYSDCGATVLENYQQVKVSAAAEPASSRSASTSFPDGRIIQTARARHACACTIR